MKLKLLGLLVAMLAVIAMLASCFGGGGEGNGDGGNGNGGDGGATGEYPWTSSEILVELYENDNAGELKPEVRRYYAGEDTSADAFATIDTYVRNRNKAATDTTKVKPIYTYQTTYTWGTSTDRIQGLTKSGATTAPDVFCNFAYDMTGCAIRGCFANLYANTSKSSTVYGSGNNYFEFTKDGYVGTGADYFDSEAGKGYFFDYMQSLAFANAQGEYDKLYCIGSNYCTDLVRAFLVIPVNVSLMESISLADSTGDEDGNQKFDINDFYSLVWDNRWTYDTLAFYSNRVFVNTNTANDKADIKDTLGFAAGRSSGLTGSGFVYTTSVKIIQKVQNTDGTYTYDYGATNQGLVDLATALNKLFSENESNGVCVVSRDDVTEAGDLGAGVDTDLLAIRSRFVGGNILFGGIIAVGSLEDQAYQDLNETSGFGIVPVPLYNPENVYNAETNPNGDEYLTLVHNLARIVAISATTTDFEQCSAFLNYQSTNSAEILDAYYEQELVAKTGGVAGDNNKKMLTYIRNHVRDCFDKTYEDVIASYTSQNDDEAMAKRWHGMLMNNGYKVSNMSNLYQTNYPDKQAALKTVLQEWAKLP